MNELENLRPEVREALAICDRDLPFYTERPSDHWSEPSAYYKVRAELLRLTRDNDALRSKCNVIMSGSTRHLGRAERAEAELAALKARIADGWLCGVSNDACPGNFDAAIYCLPSHFRGKRVRLVVEE